MFVFAYNSDMSFPNRIRQIRQGVGDNQAEFAKRFSVQRGAVTLWESGKSSPTIKTAAEIARVGNVSLDWLVNGEEKQEAKMSDDETRLIVAFQSLGKDEKAAIMMAIMDLLLAARMK